MRINSATTVNVIKFSVTADQIKGVVSLQWDNIFHRYANRHVCVVYWIDIDF